MWADSRPPAARRGHQQWIGLPRSYLRTPDGCIVWYEHRTCGAPRQSSRAVLDVDNTIGRGPETTTITNALASLGGQGYCFYVKQYRHSPPSRLLRVALPARRAHSRVHFLSSVALCCRLLPSATSGDSVVRVQVLSGGRAACERRDRARVRAIRTGPAVHDWRCQQAVWRRRKEGAGVGRAEDRRRGGR